ncbi:TMV resistance protein N-like [Quercus lobata]|uniref:TMV resistance protein N-like n=1 Tax=Quercus lobata TaxID=97700 RepID=UPI0012458794|nr:TMV resistance protein N-like [Quercus lobata]
MATMKCKRESLSSPSSSSTRQWKYDVFLSFRGEDTRNNFTDHLYVALQRKDILTFRDEKLEKGKSISELFKTIEKSQIAIIILSKNYASSTWCLDELAKIVKCREEMGLIVLPIFYDVDPTDVRNQTGTFEQAFTDHQERFKDNTKKVETWRATLRKVADISGWHLQNRREAEFIQDIVNEIMEKLSSKSSSSFAGDDDDDDDGDVYVDDDDDDDASYDDDDDDAYADDDVYVDDDAYAEDDDY